MYRTKITRFISRMSVLCLVYFFGTMHTYAAITAPTGTGLPTGTVEGVLGKAVTFFLNLVGALAVLMVIVGGIMYITSGGDSTKTETAKKIIMYSIIGIVVVLLAYVIVNTVITTI